MIGKSLQCGCKVNNCSDYLPVSLYLVFPEALIPRIIFFLFSFCNKRDLLNIEGCFIYLRSENELKSQYYYFSFSFKIPCCLKQSSVFLLSVSRLLDARQEKKGMSHHAGCLQTTKLGISCSSAYPTPTPHFSKAK